MAPLSHKADAAGADVEKSDWKFCTREDGRRRSKCSYRGVRRGAACISHLGPARKYTDANFEKKKKKNRETQKEPVRNCTNKPDVKVSLLVEARIGRSYKTDISSVFGAKTKRLT